MSCRIAAFSRVVSEFKEELVQQSRRLFVLDSQRETAEVLRAVLGKAGTDVRPVQSWQQIEYQNPEESETVVVINARVAAQREESSSATSRLPRVVIGDTPTTGRTAPRGATSPNNEESGTRLQRHLDELFEYPDLVQAIESLWQQKTPVNGLSGSEPSAT